MWLDTTTPASWTVSGSAEQLAEGCHGTYAARIEAMQYDGAYDEVDVLPGDSGMVRASAWFRAVDGSSIPPHLLIHLYTDMGGSEGQLFELPPALSTDEWTMHQIELPLTPATDWIYVALSNQQPAPSTARVMVDGMSLTIGP
jgi:hypothetical protein